MKTRICLIIGFAAIVVFLLFFPGSVPTAKEKERKIITIGTSLPFYSIAYVSTYNAQYLGYFEEEGLEVTVVPLKDSGTCTTAAIAGRVQIAKTTLDPFIQAQAKQDTGLIAIYKRGTRNIYYPAVPAESNILNIKDFKGKRIGIAGMGSGSHMFAKAHLRDVGIDPERDVTWVPVGIMVQAGEALKRGDVDCLYEWINSYVYMEEAGIKLRYLPEPDFAKNMFGTSLLVKKEYFQNNRDVLLGLCRAITKGTVFHLNNPEASLTICWKLYPESIPTGKDKNIARREQLHELNATLHGWSIKDKPYNKYGMFRKEEVEALVMFNGVQDKIPDPTVLFTNELIEGANKFDIGKIEKQAREFKP
jgi:NitT/TauT family transport system substrate-binding protein